MKKLLRVLIIFLLSGCSYALEELERGVGINSDNKDTLWNSSIPYAVARQGLRSVTDDEYIVAFQELDSYVLGLSDTARLLEVQMSDRSLLGSWPLTRWSHLYYPKILLSTYASIGAEEWEFGTPIYSGPLAKSLGCFNKSPLRYGTIFDGEEKEIVLFLNDQFIVFSPKYERIVFAEILDNGDWMSAEETNSLIDRNGLNETPQFASQLIADNTSAAEPGMRLYSKLFMGDFDDDGSVDILVWRKYYKTNLRDNDVNGFTLQSNQWQHYERDLAAQAQTGKGVTGEYLPQETSEFTIRQWLSGNNLTWKKGFPNKSECSDEEGKLIPDMHDPLLNDPDVLK